MHEGLGDDVLEQTRRFASIHVRALLQNVSSFVLVLWQQTNDCTSQVPLGQAPEFQTTNLVVPNTEEEEKNKSQYILRLETISI